MKGEWCLQSRPATGGEQGERRTDRGRGRVMQRPIIMMRVFFCVQREVSGQRLFSERAPQPRLLHEPHSVAMWNCPSGVSMTRVHMVFSFLGSLYFSSLRAGTRTHLATHHSDPMRVHSSTWRMGGRPGSQNPTLAVGGGSRKESSLETPANWEGVGQAGAELGVKGEF